MGTEKLDDQIKVRVPAEIKLAYEQWARQRHLDMADVVREALRDFLGRQNGGSKPDPNQMEMPVNGKVKAA